MLQPPALKAWNGALQGYVVHYLRLYSSAIQQEITVSHPNTSAMLTNLVRGHYYELRLSAFNQKGAGPQTRPLDVYVGDAGKHAA